MATSQVETVSTGADKAKLALRPSALVIAAFAGFLPAGQAGADRPVGCAAGRVWVLPWWCLPRPSPGKELRCLWHATAWREVKKVVWPTRKEAIQMTAYVFAFVVVMALFLWLTDKTLEWVFYDLLLGWKK
jgi:preprotein translocase subunit SecE